MRFLDRVDRWVCCGRVDDDDLIHMLQEIRQETDGLAEGYIEYTHDPIEHHETRGPRAVVWVDNDELRTMDAKQEAEVFAPRGATRQGVPDVDLAASPAAIPVKCELHSVYVAPFHYFDVVDVCGVPISVEFPDDELDGVTCTKCKHDFSVEVQTAQTCDEKVAPACEEPVAKAAVSEPKAGTDERKPKPKGKAMSKSKTRDEKVLKNKSGDDKKAKADKESPKDEEPEAKAPGPTSVYRVCQDVVEVKAHRRIATQDRGQYAATVVSEIKNRLGCPQPNEANRLAARRMAGNIMTRHGVRPAHQRYVIERIVAGVFVPDEADLDAARMLSSRTMRELREELGDAGPPNAWSELFNKIFHPFTRRRGAMRVRGKV